MSKKLSITNNRNAILMSLSEKEELIEKILGSS